MTNELLLNIYK